MYTNSITTAKLTKLLKTEPDEFYNIKFVEPVSLTKLLEKLRKEQDISKAKLIILTGLSKPYLYQVLNGSYIPGRNALLRITLSLKASLDDTQRFLTLAKQSILYPKIKRDAAIMICIYRKYSMWETNEFLMNIREESLL